MTSQTKHFIDLTDLMGIRFECKSCGSSLLVPLRKHNGELRNIAQIPETCASCDRNFWTDVERHGPKRIKALLDASGAISNLIGTQNVKFSLEIEPDALPSATEPQNLKLNPSFRLGSFRGVSGESFGDR